MRRWLSRILSTGAWFDYALGALVVMLLVWALMAGTKGELLP